MGVRFLFLADSHLGLDTTVHARIARRRRGDDFLANHRTALQRALHGDIDFVVHGGDVFDRPRVPASLAYQAYEPLLRVAKQGLPVFIVPGNHERSKLPHAHLLHGLNIHIFDTPRKFAIDVRGQRVLLAGFPYERRDVRTGAPRLIEQTGWSEHDADIRLLCIHHCVEGATVGPQDYTFTTARDVIRHCDVPPAFDAVLSGHIHRHQVLRSDLRGRALSTQVLYPGSVERTAFAEMGERKGYMIVECAGGGDVEWEFIELPARPMCFERFNGADWSAAEVAGAVRAIIEAAPADAVLTIHIAGELSAEVRRSVSARELRQMAPPTMNVDVRLDDVARVFARPRVTVSEAVSPTDHQLQFGI